MKPGEMLVRFGVLTILATAIAGVIALFLHTGWMILLVAAGAACSLFLIAGGKIVGNRAARLVALAARRFQLSLQFPGASLSDYHAMLELQQLLALELGSSATVAGHDMADGETSIFLHTQDPESTFERCKPVLLRMQALAGLTAAYRCLNSDDYQILWPQQFAGRFAAA
ncbi:MAG: hypothetical protein V4631_10590 [Pseudomonadota bacterium]